MRSTLENVRSMEGLADIVARCKPLRRVLWMPEFDPGEMPKRTGCTQRSELALAPAMRCGNPDQNRLLGEEGTPHRLTIPVPQLLTGEATTNRPFESAPKNTRI